MPRHVDGRAGAARVVQGQAREVAGKRARLFAGAASRRARGPGLEQRGLVVEAQRLARGARGRGDPLGVVGGHGLVDPELRLELLRRGRVGVGAAAAHGRGDARQGAAQAGAVQLRPQLRAVREVGRGVHERVDEEQHVAAERRRRRRVADGLDEALEGRALARRRAEIVESRDDGRVACGRVRRDDGEELERRGARGGARRVQRPREPLGERRVAREALEAVAALDQRAHARDR